MWRFLRIIMKPHKKFFIRIYAVLITLVLFMFLCLVFGDLLERLLVEIELKRSGGTKLSAQEQLIKYAYNSSTKSKHFLLKSECDCRKWEEISIEATSLTNNEYSDTRINMKRFLYKMSADEFTSSRFTCDLYPVFRRGKHQKVLSFNVFGKNSRYFFKIAEIAKQVKQFYPSWLIRVYSNDSLKKSIKCKYECTPEDNVDFCRVDHILLNPDFHLNETHLTSWNASYIQPTMWRFLPIGDSFVDIFTSRDTDSYIIEREPDSVNVWLKSGKIGHIMRDHPYHKAEILAGMWGLRVDKDRDLAAKIWEILVDPIIAREYNPYIKDPYQSDQYWLKKYIWPYIKNSSIIHDSYDCLNHVGSSAWPTRRKGDCFVGAYGGCWEVARHIECPLACRPKDHPEWIYC